MSTNILGNASLLKVTQITISVVVAMAFQFSKANEKSDVNDLELLKQFEQLSLHKPSEVTKTHLSKSEIASLYRKTLHNPISELTDSNTMKYDPDGIIGFCFGRAMSAHLTARQSHQLDSKSIFKLFIVGDLRSNSEKPEWRFHVTTVVPSLNGNKKSWVAIDPIFGKPLLVGDWIKEVKKGWDSYHKDSKGKARLYLVSANAVLPDIRLMPEPESGEHLIELNFDNNKHGIKTSQIWSNRFQTNEPIFSLTSDQEKKYFLVTEQGPTQYSFLGLTVNTEVIGYKNYFVDLLAYFHSSPQRTRHSPNMKSLGPELHISATNNHEIENSIGSAHSFESLPANLVLDSHISDGHLTSSTKMQAPLGLNLSKLKLKGRDE